MVRVTLNDYEKRMKKLEKKLSRREKRIKSTEDLKISEGVFDKDTLFTLYWFVNKGIFEILYGIVSTGKEANVYWAKDEKGKEYAVKIYRAATSDFKKTMQIYIHGDPRFKHVKRTMRSLIVAWAEKEYKNLRRAYEAGVRVPKPVAVRKNVLVMEFIGKNGVPAPIMRENPPEDPEKIFNILLNYVKRLYKFANLVHGDLSEYNVLLWDENPILIDMAQSVVLNHPLSQEFLMRDLKNLLKYFGNLGVDVLTLEEAFKFVTEE